MDLSSVFRSGHGPVSSQFLYCGILVCLNIGYRMNSVRGLVYSLNSWNCIARL